MTNNSRPEPRFDHDYAYGAQAELFITDTFEGLKAGTLRAETKRKRRNDTTVFVEIDHDPGRTGTFRPSGLTVTDCHIWAFYIGDTRIVTLVPVDVLRAALATKRPILMDRGSCPTHGYLITIEELVKLASRIADQ